MLQTPKVINETDSLQNLEFKNPLTFTNKRLELIHREKHQTPQTIKEFIEPRLPIITPAKSDKPFSDAAKNFQSKVKKFTLPQKAALHKVPNPRKPVFPPMRSRLT